MLYWPVLAILCVVISCTKEDVKTQYTRQEENIESFVNSTLSSIDTAYVVRNGGTSRVVTVYGEGDSLKIGGTVSFYYAGYVLSSSSLTTDNLFATNSEDVATVSGWSVSGEEPFAVKTLNIGDKDIVDGLRYGLVGVKAGQECYIFFSGKYGFGKRPLGTIPANAALAYHVWVESISNE